jgi:beta-galactosidase
MVFGTDYYPEHWPEERWPIDLELMKQAGIDTIRIAEFTWSIMEPEEGHYDFSWLDRIISMAAEKSIKVILCTPTAAPPKWLMDKHPEIYQKDEFGNIRGFGSRRHYCFNSQVFREYSVKIISEMANRYADNENVIAWQLDNEFGCHNTVRCYCEDCSSAFSIWLEEKYKTINLLNEKLGMAFWGQHYPSFESVILPSHTTCDNKAYGMNAHNPGLFLDYCRFASDSVYDYSSMQVDVLRSHGIEIPITHNFMGSFFDLDYYKLQDQFEFISWDCYPNIAHGPFSSLSEVSYNHDKMRGYKNKKFWVMEHCSGQNGWNYMYPTPNPGELRLWTYQSIAHGADGIVYFRWRPCLFGTEQYWHGILDHDGIPRQRYDEIKATGKELRRLEDIISNSSIVSEVCVVNSFDNEWSHTYQKHSENFNYNQILYTIHNAITDLGINCDVVDMGTDLSKYKVAVLAAYNISSESDAVKLEEFVKNGGTLVVTFRSGNRDEYNKINGLTIPGYFKEICGIEVINYDAVGSNKRSITGITGLLDANTWCDLINSKDSTVLAEYNDGFYKGSPCITKTSYSNGAVYYIGAHMDRDSYKGFFDDISINADVKRCPVGPVKGVETVTWENSGNTYIFVMNHLNSAVYVPLDREYTELIQDKKVSSIIRLEPYGVAVLK